MILKKLREKIKWGDQVYKDDDNNPKEETTFEI